MKRENELEKISFHTINDDRNGLEYIQQALALVCARKREGIERISDVENVIEILFFAFPILLTDS